MDRSIGPLHSIVRGQWIVLLRGMFHRLRACSKYMLHRPCHLQSTQAVYFAVGAWKEA